MAPPAISLNICDRSDAWNPEKNRTTSAVVYVRNDGEPLLIHNYWADTSSPSWILTFFDPVRFTLTLDAEIVEQLLRSCVVLVPQLLFDIGKLG
jgi:hypothetical protein